jgi:hypothetical protein
MAGAAAPAPLSVLLSRREVDALYDCVQGLATALDSLGARWCLVAGSLLGAVRSGSLLFCDDDVDVAILEEDYVSVRAALGALLRTRGVGCLVTRPWPGADRVRPARCSHVWVDLFVLRRFSSRDELAALLRVKANGQPQPAGYCEGLLAQIEAGGGAPRFPLWHYDNRKAIELWPREFFAEDELLPLRSDLPFGPLAAPCAPARPIRYLLRAYGDDVFSSYRIADSHVDWCKELRERVAASGLVPGAKAPLEDVHYLPVQHSLRARRVDATDALCYGRAKVQAFVARELELERQREAQWSSSWSVAVAAGALTAVVAVVAADAPAAASALATTTTTMTHPTPPPTPASAAKPSWFGAAVRASTNNSPAPLDFSPALLTVMEPHIAKARAGRVASAARFSLCERARAALASPAFGRLAREADVSYDAERHDLGGHLARALGVPRLAELREQGPKAESMKRLREPAHRRAFHAAFDAFVLEVVAPSVRGAGSFAVMRYQAFPCVRVILPGEFSLGPHCDAAYGHSPAAVNVVVPLTHASGSSALYIESRPGLEDWHPVDLAPGAFKRFHGSQCLHWTSENATEQTRASLDFRVVAGDCWDPEADPYSRVAGFYVTARWVESLARFVRDEGALPEPDKRAGFPFS